jgi:protein phosphatase methylesterase 1
MDLRGHGGTKTYDSDLSATVMANDVARVIASLYPAADVPILLIGHSMGGAIAVHVADMGLIPNLAGVAVIDVVGGAAKDALTSMQSFLRDRPSQFTSLDQAIKWWYVHPQEVVLLLFFG